MKKTIWIILGSITLLLIAISIFIMSEANNPITKESTAISTQIESKKEQKEEMKVENKVEQKEEVEVENKAEDETKNKSTQEKEDNGAVVDKVYEEVYEAPQIEKEVLKPEVPKTTNIDGMTLSNKKNGWWFSRNSKHLPPTAQKEIDLKQYDAYYLGNTEEKVIYLTFDEGYENGFTPAILDTLKANDVQAAFFITQHYLTSEPELVKRMVEEGHVVGNHSVKHPSFPEISDDRVDYELNELANNYKELTGKDMAPFFRPPMGEYSERTLYLAKKHGYKTIFWSMAHRDWLVDDQPGKEAAYQHVMDNYHPGAIILLHAVSKSNTEALDQILKDLKKEGYRFASLYELP